MWTCRFVCGVGLLAACALGAASHARAEAELAALERSCEDGDASACRTAAGRYADGEGVPEDDDKAIDLYLRACDLGAQGACTYVARGLASGLGGPDQRAEGRALLQRGCERGDAESCLYYGSALRQSVGGPADAAGGMRAHEKACDGGDAQGCHNLAVALRDGMGGPADPERSAKLLASLGGRGAPEKEKPEKQGWSTQIENLSISTREGVTKIGSMTIGSGSETATFTDVESSCGMIALTAAFTSAAAPLRACLGETDRRHVVLEVAEGSVSKSSVEPDDEVGRCVAGALEAAHLGNLSCTLDTIVSR